MLTFVKRKVWQKFDFILFFAVILLNIYGFISIYIATDSTSLLRNQGAALFLGIVSILVLVFIDYDIFGKLYIPIYIISNLLLISVLFFNVGEVKGAYSWVKIGGIQFQPSELVKVTVIISLAQYITKNKETLNYLSTLIKVLIFAGIPIGLVLLQKDFGTAFVYLFITIVMLYIAGLDYKYILYASVGAIASFPLMWFFFFDVYQKNRIRVFLNPSLDITNSGYQVTQAKTAIGSGWFLGRLIDDEAKFASEGYLPESHNDMIFAVIGENFGLIGAGLLLLLYFIMVYRLVYIARTSKDLFGSLIIVGITAMFVFHIVENIGMTIGLMPVTGIPLPFISHGGTFLLANMISIGLALSIGTKRNRVML